MAPIFFKTQIEFRNWLEIFHDSQIEVIVGFYKVSSCKPSMTWSESVDQAICFGWIDGIRKSIDNESYSIRFTPRKKSSIWSVINIRKVEILTKKGLMTNEGQIIFSKRIEAKSKVYSHEVKFVKLEVYLENRFKENELAWSFFICQTPSYKKRIVHWIMSAKKEGTKNSRLARVIEVCLLKKRLIQ
jgi:uncharacterized protein YdeI (YjbR/CyaY-like superfamily)